MTDVDKNITIPAGPLGIIALESSKPLAQKVDSYLVKWRAEREHKHSNEIAFHEYSRDSYLLKAYTPRFGSGEGKGLIKESVRGDDLYILVDVTNHSIKYTVSGFENRMSPDDHYQDLKRIIAAVGGKAKRITVIMPFLYESRQHRRHSRESLDCALALQELVNMGVESIITFDAHDPRVQNAIPLHSFESVQCTYQFIKTLISCAPDIKIDPDHLMIVSPDEGAMSRAVYFSNVLEVDLGMFYKRRDHSVIINGQNPVVAHEFLGSDLEGKDVVIIDDMISSGGSMIEVAKELRKRKANRIFCATTFGLFTNGLESFDKAYEEGLIDKVMTTNLIYQPEELLERPWYASVDMSKYIALLIDTLNHDRSISPLLSPTDRIRSYIKRFENGDLNK
ncbi:MAG: ribose-phosphate pyrophosphokinase [Clostridiales bacterium]|nr:ribose-phosphate pyrophosphokinase [Clostridiales bacterium]